MFPKSKASTLECVARKQGRIDLLARGALVAKLFEDDQPTFRAHDRAEREGQLRP
jgi:hypothetical protein